MKKANPEKFDVENHLFQFNYSDGFNDRLLCLSLLVDVNFDYRLEYKTFKTKEHVVTGTLNTKISGNLLRLLESDLNDLEDSYAFHEGATDFPTIVIKVNQYGKTRNLIFGVPFQTLNANSPSENLLFEVVKDMIELLEQLTGMTLE